MVGPEETLKTQVYKAYHWRWLVLFAFCTFSVTDQDIVWFSNCYYITYVAFCLLSIRPLEKRLDLSLFLAAFLSALGSWFIYIAEQTYSFALLGFILIGMGQIFILAAPAYISERWFPMHERNISTSLGSFFSLVGLNFSIVYASITFQNVTDQDEIMYEIDLMNLLFAIFTTMAFLFCVIMIRNKPANPPSISAATEKMLILPSIKRAFNSFESIMDLMTFSMFIGVSWSYMVVMTILLTPFNYTTEQIGYVSIVYAATGAVGGILASIYVDYQIKNNTKPHYDYLIKGFLTIGVLGILIKALVINYVDDTAIVVLSGIIGFGLNSFLPLAMQCYIEKLFPSFELVLTTAIMQMSNLFGFILNYILILDVFLDFGLWVILIAIAPFYFYLIFGFKTKFLRLEMEQQ
ncbi:unnamed protein product [Paramecium sonneborni]|uniref:Uncharacterized protein n=1 Tax=Paramecium sonneborni TaxID=65129 RepID=A0A8S1KHK9_9CILI|nr:unnamed protein product [Paramecium sonneborni]